MKLARFYATLTLLTVSLPMLCLADVIAPVPELSPAAASGAIGVLIGAGFLLRDRFRNR